MISLKTIKVNEAFTFVNQGVDGKNILENEQSRFRDSIFKSGRGGSRWARCKPQSWQRLKHLQPDEPLKLEIQLEIIDRACHNKSMNFAR